MNRSNAEALHDRALHDRLAAVELAIANALMDEFP